METEALVKAGKLQCIKSTAILKSARSASTNGLKRSRTISVNCGECTPTDNMSFAEDQNIRILAIVGVMRSLPLHFEAVCHMMIWASRFICTSFIADINDASVSLRQGMCRGMRRGRSAISHRRRRGRSSRTAAAATRSSLR